MYEEEKSGSPSTYQKIKTGINLIQNKYEFVWYNVLWKIKNK